MRLQLKNNWDFHFGSIGFDNLSPIESKYVLRIVKISPKQFRVDQI